MSHTCLCFVNVELVNICRHKYLLALAISDENGQQRKYFLANRLMNLYNLELLDCQSGVSTVACGMQ